MENNRGKSTYNEILVSQAFQSADFVRKRILFFYYIIDRLKSK